MSVYQTEEEQVEALKKWWQENGKSVVAGVVIGLGAVFGWQSWGEYKERVGGDASVAFNQMITAVESGDSDSASKQAELLRLEYESSNYAVFAALAQARIKIEAGDSPAARSQLEWAIDNASESGLKQIAQLRLARILLSEGDLDGAAAQAKVDSGSYAGEFAALRGDIALARQDNKSARDAYSLALANGVGNSALVQMKLDDLAVETP
ncbi:MAG: tetratricopeptide repeat protein [gamma proteobacterium endosymbiont of Lamellibrachia anaximandri]|nr:tetratricopeptide repeat protein [gamma proteobacterium endosymbiont of Lamellibrachia anaximandri]MBL3617785.1 tetratricopeptide repeat protein [gamma proteobacterium endosymbiont of Lamellibrachia anaximandri]